MLVEIDFEDRLAAVVATVRAYPVRDLGVTTIRARVDGHVLGLVMGPTLPLTLLRNPLLWDGHDLLTFLKRPQCIPTGIRLNQAAVT